MLNFYLASLQMIFIIFGFVVSGYFLARRKFETFFQLACFILYMCISFFRSAVQPIWVFKSGVVYLFCVWVFWCFLAFYMVNVAFSFSWQPFFEMHAHGRMVVHVWSMDIPHEHCFSSLFLQSKFNSVYSLTEALELLNQNFNNMLICL